MKNPFWNSHVYAVIKGMKATGNTPGMVARWIATVGEWANRNALAPEAKTIRAMMPYWRARPFYTASELAPILPALIVAFSIAERPPAAMSGARLGFQLDYGGLPKLRNANGTTYFHDAMGILQEFYIVEEIHKWSTEVLTQEEFENVLFD
jgi:hypothetical protein